MLGNHAARHQGMFGAKDEVDPVQRPDRRGPAWGGNPEKDALYLNVRPTKERRQDGLQAQRQGRAGRRLLVDQRLQRQGLFREERLDAYSLNNITAKKNADGSVTIQFGGCDGKIPNCLPIMPGWNYMVRLYRPRAEILNGTWKFPEAKPTELGLLLARSRHEAVQFGGPLPG